MEHLGFMKHWISFRWLKFCGRQFTVISPLIDGQWHWPFGKPVEGFRRIPKHGSVSWNWGPPDPWDSIRSSIVQWFGVFQEAVSVEALGFFLEELNQRTRHGPDMDHGDFLHCVTWWSMDATWKIHGEPWKQHGGNAKRWTCQEQHPQRVWEDNGCYGNAGASGPDKNHIYDDLCATWIHLAQTCTFLIHIAAF